MMEVRVPTSYTEAIKLINDSGKGGEIRWGFYSKKPNVMTERMYGMYSPIAYVYENDELKYAAHFKHNKVMAYDPLDNLVELSDEQNTLIEEKIKSA